MSEKRLNILEGIEKGTSQSYLGAFNKIVNLDIDSVPGAVLPQWKLQQQFPSVTGSTYEARTITADASTDEIISASYPIRTDLKYAQAVRFTTTGTLPAGLAVNTTYYKGNGTTDYRIKVSTSLANLEAGTYVDITDTGTGTHTMTAEIMSLAKKIIPCGNYFVAIDYNDKVWILLSSSYAWSRVAGHGTGSITGLAYWKNYIIIAHSGGNLDALGPIAGLGSVGTWTNAFAAISANSYAPSLIMSNDILYIGGDNDVSSLEEVSTFDPASGATFTFISSALDLPANEDIYSLEQLGSYLMIGTGGTGIGKIYSWDTVSPSFEEPIKTNIPSVSTMIAIDGILYFIDTYWGTIYATNGTSVQKIKDFPESSLGIQQLYRTNPVTIYSGGTSIMRMKDKILFGVGGSYMPGIYSYNIKTGALALEYNVASEYSGSSAVYFYAMCGFDIINFYVSVYDPSIAGTNYDYQIQTLYISNAYKPTTSYFETGLMTVGDKYQPATFRFFEIQCGKELAGGEVITIAYRVNQTDSYTTVGTMSYSSDGAVHSKIIENSSVSGDQIQFKVTITTSGTAQTGPEIKAIYIY
jgi:hypothetical protein